MSTHPARTFPAPLKTAAAVALAFSVAFSVAFAVALAVALSAAPAALAQSGADTRERDFRDLVLDTRRAQLEAQGRDAAAGQGTVVPGGAPAAGNGPPGYTFAIIPEFSYIGHGDMKGTIEGTELWIASGDSKAYSVTIIAGKQINDWFKLSFLYEFSYTKYSGGLLSPTSVPGLSGHTDMTDSAHLVGLIANFTSKTIGNIEVSLMEAWDIYSGTETMTMNGAELSRRSAGAFDDRVFSFIVWWDKEFAINDSWTIDPYLGWRSVQVELHGMNDFTQNDPSVLKNDSSYTHIVSGGLKFKYSSGLSSFYLRAGVNHRLTKDPIPGFSSRAVAPGVVNLGFMSNWDRTIATWGIGYTRVVPGKFVIDISYNGGKGSNTNLHTATAALVFLF
jgi:hypothetical protein